ncbi:MAG: mechanosensitive ion channel [Deltaproteobacteria bacterium]|nr:mechanosensitive ion channel [Deltaproteobacteria bacterium]
MDIYAWLGTLFISFLILVLFWAIGKSSEYTLNNWVSILVKKTPTELDDRILERGKKPIHYLILFIGIYIAFTRLPLAGTFNSIIDGIIYVAGISIAVYLVYSVFDEALKWYAEKIAKETESRLDKEFLPLIEKLLAIFIFLGGLIAILKHFNQDIYSLVTALGVGSLAIGLAAKDTLANMISGFTIMVDRPFRPGDRVELGSGEIGDVLEIGMRSTKIKTFYNTILVVPNSDLVNTRLVNHSYPDSKVSGRVEVGIAYGTDVELAKKTMIESALAVEEVLRDPSPAAYFTGFGDSALDMMLAFWVDNYSIRFATQDKINMEINRRFAGVGIDIPFPMRTVITRSEAPEEKKVKVKKTPSKKSK